MRSHLGFQVEPHVASDKGEPMRVGSKHEAKYRRTEIHITISQQIHLFRGTPRNQRMRCPWTTIPAGEYFKAKIAILTFSRFRQFHGGYSSVNGR